MDYDYVPGVDKFVFFLHGWGGDKNSFSFVKNHIAKDCSMVFVSFSGFGLSPPPERPFYVYDYAVELKDLVDKLAKNKKICFVAHSFGARVISKFNSLYPEIVEKIIIVDGAGLRPRRKIGYYFKVFRYKWLKKQVNKGLRSPEILKKFGSSDYQNSFGVMKKTFVNVVNENLEKCYKLITCDTLLFWGECDKETPIYMAKKLNKVIKNSELFILKKAGHFSYLNEPEVFIYKLNHFLF